MPFQPINFLNAPVAQMPDFVKLFTQGMQAGLMPSQVRRQREQEDLADALTRQKLQQSQRDSAKHDLIMSLMPGKSSQGNQSSQETSTAQPSIMQMFGGNQPQSPVMPQPQVQSSSSNGPDLSASNNDAWMANYKKEFEALSPAEKKALYRKEWGITQDLPEEQDARKLNLFKQEKDYEKKYGPAHELQGPARQVADLAALEKQYPSVNGVESPQVKLAKQLFQGAINRGFGSSGIRQEANVISNIAKDNPNLGTDAQVREATDRAAGGFDTLEDGTPINVSNITKQALNQWVKSGASGPQLNNLIAGEQGTAELGIAKKYINKAIGYYGDTLGGWSPALTADIGKAKAGDKDAESRVADQLVKNVLAQEWAQVQERMTTGKSTVSGRHELLSRAANDVKGDFNTFTAKTQQLANNRLENVLNEMFAARKKVGAGAFTATTGHKDETNNNSPPPGAKIRRWDEF